MIKTPQSHALRCSFREEKRRSKAQQQQHTNNEQGITDILVIIGYQKINQYQQ